MLLFISCLLTSAFTESGIGEKSGLTDDGVSIQSKKKYKLNNTPFLKKIMFCYPAQFNGKTHRAMPK
jgi:hypothetical protein